jgi:ribosomal protein S1
MNDSKSDVHRRQLTLENLETGDTRTINGVVHTEHDVESDTVTVTTVYRTERYHPVSVLSDHPDPVFPEGETVELELRELRSWYEKLGGDFLTEANVGNNSQAKQKLDVFQAMRAILEDN